MDRRVFLRSGALTVALTAAAGNAVSAGAMSAMAETNDQAPQLATPKAVPDRGPRIADDLVKAFVIAGHGDLAKVEAMLKEQPKLINAVWDWGGGDYESALGGAAHTGHAEIARFLLAHGARLDLFAAAMLGELEIVKAALVAFPDALTVLGPHGIPLIVHAKMSGEKAAAVLALLEQAGAKA